MSILNCFCSDFFFFDILLWVQQKRAFIFGIFIKFFTWRHCWQVWSLKIIKHLSLDSHWILSFIFWIYLCQWSKLSFPFGRAAEYAFNPKDVNLNKKSSSPNIAGEPTGLQIKDKINRLSQILANKVSLLSLSLSLWLRKSLWFREDTKDLEFLWPRLVGMISCLLQLIINRSWHTPAFLETKRCFSFSPIF